MNDKKLLVSGAVLSILALALASNSLLAVNTLSKSVNLLASASSALGRGECASRTERPCYELIIGSNHVMLPEKAGEKQLSAALSTTQTLVATLLCNPDDNIVWGNGNNLETVTLAFLNGDRTLLKFTGICNSGDNIVWGD